MLSEEAKSNLINQVLPFWTKLKDEEYGGYYGFMDYDLKLDKEAVKGVILNSRILWFFTNAAVTLQEPIYMEYAQHSYEFLKNHCLDKENGGVYWSMKYDGSTEDSTKHTYNQAFAIYALSSYYGANGNEEAKELALDLFHIIEEKCKDSVGYMEAFDQKFQLVDNDKLSENGVMASKTYNTLLHVLEAYTELYRVTKLEEVADKMKWILEQFATVLYNPKKKQMEVFFDKNMNSISDLYSYGHDIETAWLVDRACEVLGDEEYTAKILPITKALTKAVYETAFKGDSLNNECFKGEVDTTRIWWVHAEAVVGFINGYQKDNEKKEYLDAAIKIWEYIKENFVDPREGSEWFYELDQNRKPANKEIVGPWKCPYHNGRMSFELINRNIGGLYA